MLPSCNRSIIGICPAATFHRVSRWMEIYRRALGSANYSGQTDPDAQRGVDKRVTEMQSECIPLMIMVHYEIY